MYLPLEVQKQPQINAAIADVMKDLYPSVRYMRFDIGQDWSGEWSVYFRVMLSDEAARDRLSEVATNAIRRTTDRLDLPNLGLFPYFDFRSEEEQVKMGDPAWEPSVV